jgi:hypothetical protein
MEPIDTIIGWFNGLSSEEQQELAFLVFWTLPSELASSLAQDRASASTFAEQMQRWSRGTPRQHVGAVLMVASTIDLLLLGRGSEADWAKQKSVLEDAERAANVKGFATRSLQRLPERAAAWIQATAQWRHLRETALSLSSLHSWMIEQELASYLDDDEM